MKYILWIAVLFTAVLYGCEADQVNFLNVEHTMYVPDSVVFKTVPDPDDPEDTRRIEFGIPWQSGGLQGIDAGLPLDYRITGIECEEAGREASKQFYMSGINGIIELPYDHTVPPGKYVFTIELSNEGGRNKAVLYRALTIIVENVPKL